MRVVDVVELRSGYEEANAIWTHSRRNWDVSYGIKSLNDLHSLIEFWEAMGGRLHTFRFKDRSDFKSCAPQTAIAFDDQVIGTGDGATTTFQLQKTYAVGSASYVRPIKKPVAGTVVVGVNGVNQASGWTVDTTTGIVSFSVAPTNTHAVTAGFEFDVPARFFNENLPTNLELFEAGTASVEIREIRV